MRYILVPILLSLVFWSAPARPQAYPPPAPAPAPSYPLPAQYYPSDSEALVRAWYLKFLNRPADPIGLAGWVDWLNRGTPPETTLATLLSSQEYYARGGNTPEGFVQTLYQDLAGRPPTNRELRYWLQRLYQQGDRTDVAYTLLTRYPQNWQTAAPQPPPPPDYEYRRPYRRYGP